MAIRVEDLAGMDFADVAGTERIGPVTPGDVLREEFMLPLGLFACGLTAAHRDQAPSGVRHRLSARHDAGDGGPGGGQGRGLLARQHRAGNRRMAAGMPGTVQ